MPNQDGILLKDFPNGKVQLLDVTLVEKFMPELVQTKKGVAVTKVDAVNVDNWRAGHFCLNRLVVDKTHAETRTWVADGAKCAKGLN